MSSSSLTDHEAAGGNAGGLGDAQALRVVPRSRRLEYVGYAVAALLVAIVVYNVVTNPKWHLDVIGEYLFDHQVLTGLSKTLVLTALAGSAGIFFGWVVALMRLSDSRLLAAIATGYVGFIRAIPALVLLLLVYFLGALIPTASIGVPFGGPVFASVNVNTLITQFMAAWLGLTMIAAGHCGEIIRGGVIAVPGGQVDAAKALGMTPARTFQRVVGPQAIRVAIPGLANELISLFKNTSLVSVIGYPELLTSVQYIYGRNYQTIPLLLVACVWYLVLTTIAMIGQHRLEKRFGKGFDSYGADV